MVVHFVFKASSGPQKKKKKKNAQASVGYTMTGWVQLNASMHKYYYEIKRNEVLKHAILCHYQFTSTVENM